MTVPQDIVTWVEHNFSSSDASLALSMLKAAVIENDEPASPRLIRCAAVGSRGQIERLALFIKELRVDWRDVIMGGEYEMRDGKLVQVHNFERPIDA